MTTAIKTVGHQQSRLSGWRLLSLSEVWALCDLDPSHLLGDAMHPNQGAKIPDYGVQDHIAHMSVLPSSKE